MSARQIRKRVEKVEEKVCPEHDGTFLWEDFCRMAHMLDEDNQEFQERARRPDGAAYRAFLARFGQGASAT